MVVETSDQFACSYTDELTKDGAAYTFEIPAREIEYGSLKAGETFRVAVPPTPTADRQSSSFAPQKKSKT
jgi:hypothetical protein